MQTLQSGFTLYANALKKEIEALEKFQLPENFEVKIYIEKGIPQKVKDHLFFHRSYPAVYYFRVKEKDKNQIFEAFKKAKEISAKIRRTKGVQAEGFYNISHVPKDLNDGVYLYAGSRKNDLISRLNQHLGYTNSGRTGALYLMEVLKEIHPKPEITFGYFILDKSLKTLTKHIECVVQDHFKPLLGKRAL